MDSDRRISLSFEEKLKLEAARDTLEAIKDTLQLKLDRVNKVLRDNGHPIDQSLEQLLQVKPLQGNEQGLRDGENSNALESTGFHDTQTIAATPPPCPTLPDKKRKREDLDEDTSPTVAKKVHSETSSQGDLAESANLDEDVWVTAYKHNIRESGFCRLPNELIFMVISHLPEETKYLLKQVSRRFNAVYTGPGFAELPSRYSRSTNLNLFFADAHTHANASSELPSAGGLFPPVCLANPNQSQGINGIASNQAPDSALNDMFFKAVEWNDCAWKVRSNDGVLSRHDPRKNLQALIRKDIYCQPCVSVCVIEDWTSWREYNLERLQRPLHCSGCNISHPTILFSIDQRLKDDRQRICIGREGHIRLCAHRTISWSDVQKHAARTEQRTELSERRESMTVECCHKSHFPEHCRPYFSVWLSARDKVNRVADITIACQVQAAEVQRRHPLTLGQLRECLENEEFVSTMALCPHESFDDVSLLLQPFDPHHCTCTRTEAIFPSIHEKSSRCTDFGDDPLTTCCRCDCLEQDGVYDGKFLFARPPRSSEDCKSAGKPSQVNHRVWCKACATYYKWDRSDNGVVLSRLSGILSKVKTPYEDGWVSLLDPLSYNIKEPHMRHTLWCDSRGCATARHWKHQKILSAITKALRVEGQLGVPSPEEVQYMEEIDAEYAVTIELSREMDEDAGEND